MDEVEEVDELGPVDWIVVEFPGSKFNGQIAPALLDLVERDLIRVLDLLVLKKDDDGSLEAFELSDLDQGEVGDLRTYEAESNRCNEPAEGGLRIAWQVWAGEKVADLVQLNAEVVDTALSTVDKALGETDAPPARNFVADQILRETLLTVSSDWPFMVSKDSAADYARYRAHLHAHATREIAGALASGRSEQAQRLADGLEPRRRLVRRARRQTTPPMNPCPARAHTQGTTVFVHDTP